MSSLCGSYIVYIYGSIIKVYIDDILDVLNGNDDVPVNGPISKYSFN